MIFGESTGIISYFDDPLPGTRGASWRCRRKPKTSCRPVPMVFFMMGTMVGLTNNLWEVHGHLNAHLLLTKLLYTNKIRGSSWAFNKQIQTIYEDI